MACPFPEQQAKVTRQVVTNTDGPLWHRLSCSPCHWDSCHDINEAFLRVVLRTELVHLGNGLPALH
eukprot:12891484-Prorocentrum_lima.AAC.1